MINFDSIINYSRFQKNMLHGFRDGSLQALIDEAEANDGEVKVQVTAASAELMKVY